MEGGGAGGGFSRRRSVDSASGASYTFDHRQKVESGERRRARTERRNRSADGVKTTDGPTTKVGLHITTASFFYTLLVSFVFDRHLLPEGQEIF